MYRNRPGSDDYLQSRIETSTIVSHETTRAATSSRFHPSLSALLFLAAFGGPARAVAQSSPATQPATQPAKLPSAAELRLDRPHIVVADFAAMAEIDERDVWIPTALEEMLAWRLRRVDALIATPVVRAYQARRELQDDPEKAPPWDEVAKALGADWLLTGKGGGPPDETRLNMELRSLTQAGSPRVFTATPGPLRDVLDQATRWVFNELAATDGSDAAEAALHEPLTDSVSAIEYYARAILATRNDDIENAVYYGRESIGLAPNFRPALGLMAEIGLRLGPRGRAQAARQLRRLAELARQANDRIDRSATEVARGLLLQLTGSFDAAGIRFNTALELAGEAAAPYSALSALNSLADLYITRQPPHDADLSEDAARKLYHDNLRQAIRSQMAAIELLATLGDHVATAPLANKLALMHEQLDEPDAALAALQLSLDAARKANSRRNQATSWLFIGRNYQQREQWDEALSATGKALGLVGTKDKPTVHLALATIYRGKEDPQNALQQCEAAFEIVRDGTDFAQQFACLKQIAELRMQLDQPESAIDALQQAADIAHVLKLPQEADLRKQLQEWEADRR